MYEASLSTALTDFNEDKENTRAWAKLLNREGGEHENDWIHLNIEQTETPPMAKRKSQIDNVVQSYIEIKWMVVQSSPTQENSLSLKNVNASGEFHGLHSAMYEC